MINKSSPHVTGALGNLCMHSDELVKEILQQKVLNHLLAMTCREHNLTARLAAVLSLRTIIQKPSFKQAYYNTIYPIANVLNKLIDKQIKILTKINKIQCNLFYKLHPNSVNYIFYKLQTWFYILNYL